MTVITVAGRLGEALSAADRDRVLAAIQLGGQVVLDLSRVQEISGGGLRRLLLLTRHIRGLGAAVAARGASDDLRAMAEASGFEDLFRSADPLPVPSAPEAPRARTDFYPTHSHGSIPLRPGIPMPLGATVLPHGVNRGLCAMRPAAHLCYSSRCQSAMSRFVFRRNSSR